MTALLASRPYWSRAGFAEGVRLTLPLLPGAAVVGAAFGTIAAQKGLTLVETTLMSAAVYAGAAQLVAIEIWPDRFTLAAITTLALVTAIVNLRLVLMSASLRPWFGELPAWQSYSTLFFTTDATWLIAMRYRADGGSDVAMFLGSGVVLWALWVAATAAGYLLGTLLTDPARFGLDLIMPIFFVVLLVPLWRGVRRAAAWAIAGAVALAFSWLLPGWWFIIIGAVAGSVAGGFLEERA